MNKFLQISNIVLIAAVAILFILFFSSRNKAAKSNASQSKKINTIADSASKDNFKIAYFELDSVEAKYSYYNEVKNSLIAREKQVQNTLNSMQQRFENRLKGAQEKGPTLSQNEQAAIQKELENMQKEYAQKDQSLKEELIMERYKKLQTVNERIQNVAKEIAEEQGYSYVISRYESGENNIIYYRDNKFDITSELIARLNKEEKNSSSKK